jgi:hypothetical protein
VRHDDDDGDGEEGGGREGRKEERQQNKAAFYCKQVTNPFLSEMIRCNFEDEIKSLFQLH